jgi:uroporphyrinogen-III synthase
MNDARAARALSGRAILITRPREHAGPLAEAVRAAGGEPVLFPVIDIAPARDKEALARTIGSLHRFDLAVFISESAVARGCEAVLATRPWPKDLRVAAVGGSTARALERLGFTGVIAPQGQGDSEALIALPELRDVRGRSVLVFRGEGGREWLRDALELRGAAVEYAECYRRAPPPAANLAPLLARWQRGGIDAVSVTSGEGLANLFGLLGPTGKNYLRATPVFVSHRRIAGLARELGIGEAVLTGPGEEAAVAGMADFFAKVGPPLN